MRQSQSFFSMNLQDNFKKTQRREQETQQLEFHQKFVNDSLDNGLKFQQNMHDTNQQFQK